MRLVGVRRIIKILADGKAGEEGEKQRSGNGGQRQYQHSGREKTDHVFQVFVRTDADSHLENKYVKNDNRGVSLEPVFRNQAVKPCQTSGDEYAKYNQTIFHLYLLS